MRPLTTERLLIRNYRPDDWPALYAMICHYQASGMALYDEPWSTEAAEYPGITTYLAGSDMFQAVCLRDGTFIGHITLNPEQTGVYSLGYIFDTPYHGYGYAAEACRAVIKRTFRKAQVRKIVSGTALVNAPSLRLLQRLGFRRTGEAPISFQKDADGKPIEFIGTSWEMSRAEWLAQAQLLAS